MKYNAYLLEELKCKRLTIINADQDMEQQDLSQTASGNEAWYSHFGRHLKISY